MSCSGATGPRIYWVRGDAFMSLGSDLRRFISVKGAGRLFGALVLYGAGTGILAPMNAVYMREEIGLGKGQIALVFSASLLLNMTVTLTTGVLSDRMKGKKPLPLAAAVLCMAGLLIYMRASTFGAALFGMAVATAPSGLIMGQIFAMARSHFLSRAPSVAEMAMIWLRAGFSAGFFAGLLIGANLYLITGFQGVLWGNIAGYLALFVLLLRYREHRDPVPGAAARGGEAFSLTMLAALLLTACADSMRGLYLPLVVDELFGRPELMSYLWSIQAVFELGFMTLAGYWAARFGSIPVMAAGIVCALAVYGVYASAPPLPVFFLVQPVYSFAVSVLYGVSMGYVQKMFLGRVGFGSSLFVIITQGASLSGYLLPLLIIGLTPRIFSLPAVFAGAALLLTGLVIYRRRRGRISLRQAGRDERPLS